MAKKSIWDSNLWKTVIALSIILTIIVSILTILQLLGTVDLWTPLLDVLTFQISVYTAILAIILVSISIFALQRIKGYEGRCILDSQDARSIAILCKTPRTTEFLRQKYDYWESQRHVVVLGGYNFDDYMKKLEKQKFLTYLNEKWSVTSKALQYIEKYHGG